MIFLHRTYLTPSHYIERQDYGIVIILNKLQRRINSFHLLPYDTNYVIYLHALQYQEEKLHRRTSEFQLLESRSSTVDGMVPLFLAGLPSPEVCEMRTPR